jgi:hypothetical protein
MVITIFFPKDLNPSKIHVRFKIEFTFEICKSKSRDILELNQRGMLCHLDLSISIPCLKNFGQLEGYVLHFQTGSSETYLENHWIKRKKIVDPTQLNSLDREAHSAISLHQAACAPC